MVRHNNVIPFQHFHKKWARRVKTWLHQPAQKKIRREKRRALAAKLAPRPVGSLRPLVHCQTQKYNSKVKLGRGFTLEELKAAGINRSFAKTIGIAVDHRRTNKSQDSLDLNAQRLKDYKEKLVIFPRKANNPKKGDSSKEEIAAVRQNGSQIPSLPAVSFAPEFTKVTEEMTGFKAYDALRTAFYDQKLVGIRQKLAKAKADKKDDKKDDA